MAYKLSPSDVLDIANAGLSVKDINNNDITKAGIAATNILAANLRNRRKSNRCQKRI